MSDESYAVANEHVRTGELGKVVLAQIDYSRNYQRDFWAGDDYPIDPDAKPSSDSDVAAPLAADTGVDPAEVSDNADDSVDRIVGRLPID